MFTHTEKHPEGARGGADQGCEGCVLGVLVQTASSDVGGIAVVRHSAIVSRVSIRISNMLVRFRLASVKNADTPRDIGHHRVSIRVV